MTHAELLQRKLNAKSKNQELAKQEVQVKLEALKQGKLPEEYKDIVFTKKTYTAKQAFILDKDLEQSYKQARVTRPGTAKPPTSQAKTTPVQSIGIKY